MPLRKGMEAGYLSSSELTPTRCWKLGHEFQAVAKQSAPSRASTLVASAAFVHSLVREHTPPTLYDSPSRRHLSNTTRYLGFTVSPLLPFASKLPRRPIKNLAPNVLNSRTASPSSPVASIMVNNKPTAPGVYSATYSNVCVFWRTCHVSCSSSADSCV